MFGRFNEVEDNPGWRERYAEWRDSPLFVLERPEWLAEGPGVLMLLFAGILSLMAAVVYIAVPPTALPSSLPGHFEVASASAAPTTTSTSTTTTSTTMAPAKLAKIRADMKTWSVATQQKFWAYIEAVDRYNKEQARVDVILSQPIKPPTRRWAYAFLAAVLSALFLAAAWYTSETRSRRLWSH